MNQDMNNDARNQGWRNETGAPRRSPAQDTGSYQRGSYPPPSSAQDYGHGYPAPQGWKGESAPPRGQGKATGRHTPPAGGRNPARPFSAAESGSIRKGFGKAPRKGGGVELMFRQSLNDFRELFRSFFSNQPANAFKFDLAPLSWSLLLIFNVLVYALTRATYTAIWMKNVSRAMSGPAASLLEGHFGTTFAWGLLEGLAFLLACLGMIYLTSILARSERRPAIQFVKTLASSSLPYTLTLLPLIVVGVISCELAAALMVVPQILFILSLQMGFNKNHPSRRTSTFWYFALLCLVAWLLLFLIP